VCLIRETKNTRSVGVPPGTGLGNTVLAYDMLILPGPQTLSIFSAQLSILFSNILEG